MKTVATAILAALGSISGCYTGVDDVASGPDDWPGSESGAETTDTSPAVDHAEFVDAIAPDAAAQCIITNPTCPANPSLNNVPISETVADWRACTQRALDWRAACGTPAEAAHAPTKAQWGPGPSWANYKAYAPGCAVQTRACPNHPEMAWRKFWDDWEGAGSNEQRCRARAQEYADWCGKKGHSGQVSTSFTKLYGLTLPQDPYDWQNSDNLVEWETQMAGCFIRNASCANFPAYAGVEILDGATSEQACGQRVKDYRAWCGIANPGVDDTEGLFHAAWADVQRVWHIRSPGCAIFNSTCPNFPQYAGHEFSDNYNGAGSNQAACFQRAADYRAWCGVAQPGVDMSYAVFAPPDFSDFSWTSLKSPGCLIDLHRTCGNHPEYSYSVVGEAAASREACNQRAHDYYDWCGATENAFTGRVWSAYTDANYATQPSYAYPPM